MPTVSLKLSWLENIINFLNPIIYYVILFIISFCIVIFSTKRINIKSILLIILLYTLLIIIFNSFGKNLLSISVSNTVNPVPPNVGLNGISKVNMIAGKN